MMIRGLSACVLALLSATAAAEEVEQLDADFLEYLAQLEGDDDDWTLLAQGDEVESRAKEAQSEQPPQQAEKPSVDER